jgi:hypothetical protein
VTRLRLATTFPAVEFRLQPRDERVDFALIGLAASGRRHQAPAQLAHRLFEHVGALADGFRREAVVADARGLQTIVMAAGAVLLDRGEPGIGFARDGRGLCVDEYDAQRDEERDRSSAGL